MLISFLSWQQGLAVWLNKLQAWTSSNNKTFPPNLKFSCNLRTVNFAAEMAQLVNRSSFA